MKNNQIRCLVKRGITLKVVPWNYPVHEEKGKNEPFQWNFEVLWRDPPNLQQSNLVFSISKAILLDYDALFISNGPGDPEMCAVVVDSLKKVFTASFFFKNHIISGYGIKRQTDFWHLSRKSASCESCWSEDLQIEASLQNISLPYLKCVSSDSFSFLCFFLLNNDFPILDTVTAATISHVVMWRVAAVWSPPKITAMLWTQTVCLRDGCLCSRTETTTPMRGSCTSPSPSSG